MIAAYLSAPTSSYVENVDAYLSLPSASGEAEGKLFLNLNQSLACCVVIEADVQCVSALGALLGCCRMRSSVNALG